jgi:ABC-type amino acid transport system permease subunit
MKGVSVPPGHVAGRIVVAAVVAGVVAGLVLALGLTGALARTGDELLALVHWFWSGTPLVMAALGTM